jgi:3-deoxy-manno-octulosonate cytidylyltransferase (CMP-KDO synthetase)
MIQHVWEQAQKSKLLKDVIIACDDKRVFQVCKEFNGKVVMTSPEHSSGTDRIAEVVKGLKVDIIINIQGDEPLIKPEVIDALAEVLVKDDSPMATVIKKIHDEKELNDQNVVKVVIDKNQHAIYFSRSPIPFNRDKKSFNEVGYYKHLGLYAYTKDFLKTFVELPQSNLEKIEKLEQLRALEAGYKIKTIETNWETVGVDTPDDLKKVETFLAKSRAGVTK